MVGLTTALKLAEQGVSVVVVDRQHSGREASWAGAGMLPPGNPSGAATPEARLRAHSHQLWPEFAAALSDQTGIDNGYRVCGAVQLSNVQTSKEFQRQLAAWQQEGLRVEELQQSDLDRHISGLHDEFTSGSFLPDFAQVRNPRHLKAVSAACRMAGVRLMENVDAIRLVAKNQQIHEVANHEFRFQFDRVCVTAGAWSAALLEPLGIHIPISPVRGQIVQLQLPVLPFRCVIELGRRYLVPRPDGLILVGSTEEHCGFLKQNTSQGVSEILNFATSLVPALHEAAIVRMWAGLRPGSPDELPLIGQVPGWDNLFLGTGHFRSGLQMSPGTGDILSDLLVDRSPRISQEGLSCDRFGSVLNSTASTPVARAEISPD